MRIYIGTNEREVCQLTFEKSILVNLQKKMKERDSFLEARKL